MHAKIIPMALICCLTVHVSASQAPEESHQGLGVQVKRLLEQYVTDLNAQIKTIIKDKKMNLAAQKALDMLVNDIETKGNQLIKVLQKKDISYFKNERIAQEFTKFAQELANIYAELDKLREITLHLQSRYWPTADTTGIQNYSNDLDQTYRNNFKNFPNVNPKDVYALLGLSLSEGVELSNREIRNAIKRLKLDKNLVRQLDFIFRNEYTKESYDAYARNTVQHLIIGQQASEFLAQNVMPILELKELVNTILKTLTSKKVIEWVRPY